MTLFSHDTYEYEVTMALNPNPDEHFNKELNVMPKPVQEGSSPTDLAIREFIANLPPNFFYFHNYNCFVNFNKEGEGETITKGEITITLNDVQAQALSKILEKNKIPDEIAALERQIMSLRAQQEEEEKEKRDEEANIPPARNW